MNAKKKKARDDLANIKTRAELTDYLETLNITDDDRKLLLLKFCNGYTNTKISFETGYSISHVSRRLNRLYLKIGR
jgi:DNA-directed RNA polymerase specialized sigma24 family protein